MTGRTIILLLKFVCPYHNLKVRMQSYSLIYDTYPFSMFYIILSPSSIDGGPGDSDLTAAEELQLLTILIGFLALPCLELELSHFVHNIKPSSEHT